MTRQKTDETQVESMRTDEAREVNQNKIRQRNFLKQYKMISIIQEVKNQEKKKKTQHQSWHQSGFISTL